MKPNLTTLLLALLMATGSWGLDCKDQLHHRFFTPEGRMLRAHWMKLDEEVQASHPTPDYRAALQSNHFFATAESDTHDVVVAYVDAFFQFPKFVISVNGRSTRPVRNALFEIASRAREQGVQIDLALHPGLASNPQTVRDFARWTRSLVAQFPKLILVIFAQDEVLLTPWLNPSPDTI